MLISSKEIHFKFKEEKNMETFDFKEDENMKTFTLTLSKSGIPCIWESGGGWTNTGDATIICGSHGQQKRAIFVRTHGNLACDDHALIPVQVGDYVINVRHNRNSIFVDVYQIYDIDIPNTEAKCNEIVTPPTYLNDAIEACKDKSNIYHCRTPKYCIY